MPKKVAFSKDRYCEILASEELFKASERHPTRTLEGNGVFDMDEAQIEELLSKTDPCKLTWTIEYLLSKKSGEDPLFHAKPPEPNLLESRLKWDVKKPRGEREKYALLISGYNDDGTIRQIPGARLALQKEGFREQNIYVLDNNCLTDYLCPTDDVATKKSFEMIMDYFSERLGDSDLLFCFFAGHGSRRDFLPESAIPLWGGSVEDHDFLLASEVGRYVDLVNASQKVLMFSHCYCGDFASRFGRDNNIAISASKGSNPSYGRYFTAPFFRAIYDKSGDFDGEGRVSIGEALYYAMIHDPCTQKGMQEPQIFYEDLNPMNTYLDI